MELAGQYVALYPRQERRNPGQGVIGNLRMQIICNSAGIETWYWGEADIFAQLKNSIAHYEKETAATIAGLERHTLIPNPYA